MFSEEFSKNYVLSNLLSYLEFNFQFPKAKTIFLKQIIVNILSSFHNKHVGKVFNL